MIRVLIVGMLVLSAAVAHPDLSGMWTLSWEPDFGGNHQSYDCRFKQADQTLTIDCRDDPPLIGKVDGQKVTITFKTGRDGEETAVLTGEVDQSGTKITGAWHLQQANRGGRFSATKR